MTSSTQELLRLIADAAHGANESVASVETRGPTQNWTTIVVTLTMKSGSVIVLMEDGGSLFGWLAGGSRSFLEPEPALDPEAIREWLVTLENQFPPARAPLWRRLARGRRSTRA